MHSAQCASLDINKDLFLNSPTILSMLFSYAHACSKNASPYTRASKHSWINNPCITPMPAPGVPALGAPCPALLNLRLEILLGCPLHKSRWSSHNLPIKSWQQIFLDYTTPRIWELLQTKARRGRVVPSGAKQGTLKPYYQRTLTFSSPKAACWQPRERPHAGT